MNSIKTMFGKRVRELRKTMKLTQEQMAEMIEMDTQNLSKMENGSHFPQTKNLEKIAKVLNVEVKDLFEFNHYKSKENLIDEINEYLSQNSIEEVELIYKFIKNLQEYKK